MTRKSKRAIEAALDDFERNGDTSVQVRIVRKLVDGNADVVETVKDKAIEI